ncbi:glycosyltransferase [Pseudoalteromonas sp. Z9A5]|uniref:glycosyltransferase n=1 Tax=Pseudoalteromonas sp. Z9A5 TaxID=2686355 RepID=UPI001409525F|nr:glycosyltransferase [Pseudoalteromonas sp. Z9A5]
MHSPLITVYMPTHNRVNNLKRAVHSVQAQDHTNWQLIIVNDGSKDATADYLDSLVLTDERIIVFHHEIAQGACVARNKAIEAASGEFITGLDDDDAFTPNRLSYFLENWSNNYSALCTPVTVCKGQSKVAHHYFIGELTFNDILVVNKVGNQLFCKTADLKSINGFDPHFKARQDADTWVRFLKAHGKGNKLPKSTYLQYEEQSQLSITRSPSRLIGFRQFIEKHEALMSKRQRNAMACWESIIMGRWVPLYLLLKSDSDIYKYSLMHNIKKLLRR